MRAQLWCLLLCAPGILGLGYNFPEPEQTPRLLSFYNLFVDIRKQTPSEGLVRYQLNTPLFSDYTSKYRLVGIPAGQSMDYHPSQVFALPVGSILVKTFAYNSPQGEERLIETRLLLHRQEGWDALAYIWDEQQQDARLAIAGKRVPLQLVTVSGVQHDFRYRVPNKNQCATCHSHKGEISPIGMHARHLNREQLYGSRAQNQLLHLQQLGWLSGLPELTEVAKNALWSDVSEPLAARARAYLDANCGHCHSATGSASNTNLYLDANERNRHNLGIYNRPVAAGRGGGDRLYAITPGEPEQSILYYRMNNNTDPDIMMPELGRQLNHPEGLQLIHEWIEQMQ